MTYEPRTSITHLIHLAKYDNHRHFGLERLERLDPSEENELPSMTSAVGFIGSDARRERRTALSCAGHRSSRSVQGQEGHALCDPGFGGPTLGWIN